MSCNHGVSAMNKTILALMILTVVFLLGCQPATPPSAASGPVAEPGASTSQPSVTIEPGTAAPSEEPSVSAAGEVTPAPLENVPTPPETGVQIDKVCYGLLTAEEFSSICGHEGKVVLTPKISEGSCWVNIADHQNNKRTAGFTTVDWKKAEDANEEFGRGVSMRRTQGAVEGKVVGDRSYEYEELNRHNVVWLRGTFLTRLAAMTDLCPADKLMDLAKKIDERMR